MTEERKLGSMPLLTDQGEMKDFGDGVHMLHLWSNVCVVETSEGVVLFDSGFEFTGPRIVEELRAVTDKPVRYVIYGHGHADHAFGAGAVIEDAALRGFPRPVVIAHENLPARFDRYQATLAYQEHINRIQFAIPEGLPAFSRTYIYPDEIYSDGLTLRLGGVTFELRHAKGETDDTTWLWIPERKTACVTDLWVWSCPNVGNPFKVQRFTLEWARALEEVAAKEPELMLPGHGAEIAGREAVRDACLTVARAMRSLHDQVVGMLNEGMWPEEILRSFEWPQEFADSPYLEPIYGHPYFVVQAVLRQYHGWFDGSASHVFPSSSAEVAREVLQLAGGPAAVLERAEELAEEGRTQLALHVVDFLIDGGASEREALELKARLLKSRADAEKSLIARNIFLAGARRAEDASADSR